MFEAAIRLDVVYVLQNFDKVCFYTEKGHKDLLNIKKKTPNIQLIR